MQCCNDTQDEVCLDFDFSSGGAYVGVMYASTALSDATSADAVPSAIRFVLRPQQTNGTWGAGVSVFDATGQVSALQVGEW
jgi:hypothetical protein